MAKLTYDNGFSVEVVKNFPIEWSDSIFNWKVRVFKGPKLLKDFYAYDYKYLGKILKIIKSYKPESHAIVQGIMFDYPLGFHIYFEYDECMYKGEIVSYTIYKNSISYNVRYGNVTRSFTSDSINRGREFDNVKYADLYASKRYLNRRY